MGFEIAIQHIIEVDLSAQVDEPHVFIGGRLEQGNLPQIGDLVVVGNDLDRCKSVRVYAVDLHNQFHLPTVGFVLVGCSAQDLSEGQTIVQASKSCSGV